MISIETYNILATDIDLGYEADELVQIMIRPSNTRTIGRHELDDAIRQLQEFRKTLR